MLEYGGKPGEVVTRQAEVGQTEAEVGDVEVESLVERVVGEVEVEEAGKVFEDVGVQSGDEVV